MFDVHCKACDRRRMLPVSRVLGIHNDDAGIHVFYRCMCGELGTWLTGRRAAEGELAQAS